MRQWRCMLLVAVGLFARSSSAAAQSDDEKSRSVGRAEISTSGSSRVPVAVDLATLNVTFTARGQTPSLAAAIAARRANAIRAALVAVGIDGDSLPTVSRGWYWGSRSQMEVKQPDYRRAPDTTYLSNEVFTIRIRQLALIGRAIDTALVEGAQKISEVQFFATNTAGAQKVALREATRNAVEDAELMATAAGGRLGKLISLTTNSSYYDGRNFSSNGSEGEIARGIGDGPPVTTIVVPRLSVSATVNGRWEFIPR